MADNNEILFKPISEKQVYFLSSTADEVLGGGARGGGKSLVLAYDGAYKVRDFTHVNGKFTPLRISIDYPDYSALLIRRTYKDLMNNFKPFTDKLYEPLGGVWVESRKQYEFKSGATIKLAHCDTYDDIKKYIGGNYTYIGIEEINQFPKRWIDELRGSLRSANKELKPFFRGTANPGNIGHLWLKKYFVDKCPPKLGVRKTLKAYNNFKYQEQLPGDTYTDELGRTREYVPFGVLDNPILLENDPQYVKYLMGLQEPLRSMWLLGDWSVQVGSFLDWNASYHRINSSEIDYKSGAYRLYRALDYGTTNPFVCLFVAIDGDDNVFVFDEIVEKGLTATKQAKRIAIKMEELKLTEDDIYMTIADPAYWIRSLESNETPVSPANIYFRNGIEKMYKGINDRIAGAMLIRDLFSIPDEGMPKCRISDKCKYCLDTFPELVTDEMKPEDVNTHSEDHAYDALRYLTMFLFASTGIRKNNEGKKKWQLELAKKNQFSNDIPDAWAI